MILPVYISHHCTKKRILILVLLDTNTNVITEDALNMSNTNELVQSSKVSGLHVTGVIQVFTWVLSFLDWLFLL